MNELIKSIVFAVLGLAVLVLSIVTKGGVEMIVVSSLLLACGIVWIILDLVNKNKKNK